MNEMILAPKSAEFNEILANSLMQQGLQAGKGIAQNLRYQLISTERNLLRRNMCKRDKDGTHLYEPANFYYSYETLIDFETLEHYVETGQLFQRNFEKIVKID